MSVTATVSGVAALLSAIVGALGVTVIALGLGLAAKIRVGVLRVAAMALAVVVVVLVILIVGALIDTPTTSGLILALALWLSSDKYSPLSSIYPSS